MINIFINDYRKKYCIEIEYNTNRYKFIDFSGKKIINYINDFFIDSEKKIFLQCQNKELFLSSIKNATFIERKIN